MTAEFTPSKRPVLRALLALVAVGIVMRFTFVDLLTKATGTWIGGVESPHRSDASTSTVSQGPSAA